MGLTQPETSAGSGSTAASDGDPAQAATGVARLVLLPDDGADREILFMGRHGRTPWQSLR